MNRSSYKTGSYGTSTGEGSRRGEGTAGSRTEEGGQLLAPLQGNETDHDEEHEELEELEEDDDTHSTGRTATIANSFYRGPRRWWTKLKEFLYPDTPEDDIAGAPNYRYTPIISGVTIPFAILLEIPGLTEHWYIRTDSNQTVETKANPVLLDVGLGFSMACALLANIALITRFLERRVKTMTLCCVVFLTLHDIINITAVTIFGVQHRFDDGFTYGESFWMIVCSTIASTITNATLIYDLIRTPEFATSGSGLTRKQRSLIIIVIILLCYIAFGALIHCLLTELTFIDALYFTICCIETIGFGDIAMTTTGSKFFTCIYSILGILNLALAVSLTRETVIEALEASYRKRMNAVRDKRKRIRWARRVGRRWMSAVSWRLREGGKDIWVWNDELEPSTQDDDSEALGSIQKIWSILIKSYRLFRISIVHLTDRILPYQGTWEPSEKSPLWDMPHPHGMHLNLEALTESQLEAAAMEAGVPLIELVPEKFWEKREKRLKKEKERERRENRRQREKEKGSEREKGIEDEKVPLSQQDPHGPSSRTTSSYSRPQQRPSHQPSDSSISVHSHWFDRLKRVQRDIDPEEVPLSHARLGRMIGMLGAFGMAFSLDASKSHNTGNSGPSSTTKHSPCDGFDFDAAYRQKKLKEEAATEERKAFYAQLSVVWTLFLVFWMVGSAVFSVTEDWSFGNAMYFCVIAFTTIGFGDFSPHSPAGRSFFVLWALLGVATMTILISVIGEAYTTRYRTVLQSSGIPGFFNKAVARYRIKEREKMLLKSEARNRQEFEKGSTHGLNIEGLPYTGDNGSMALASDKQVSSHEGTQPGVAAEEPHTNHQHTKFRARLEKLEKLPKEILHHTKSFQEHIQYFFHGGIDNFHHSQPNHHHHSGKADGGQDDEKSENRTQGFQGSSRAWDYHRQNMPEESKEVLDEMFLDNFGASAQRFEERIAKIEREILSDGDTRQVLFTLGVERALRKMIEAAEEALESLEERDKILHHSLEPTQNGHVSLSTGLSQDH